RRPAPGRQGRDPADQYEGATEGPADRAAGAAPCGPARTLQRLPDDAAAGTGAFRGRRVAPGRLGWRLRARRDDLSTVDLERPILLVRHQVDVPLVDAGLLEPSQFLQVLLDRPEDTEALARLVRHLLPVLRPDAAVLRIVVALPLHLLHVFGQRG